MSGSGSNSHWVKPVTLEGTHVTLRPMAMSDADGLRDVVRDGELWKLWYTMIPDPDGVEAFIAKALEIHQARGDLPFVVLDKSGKIIGSTRYLNVDNANTRLEIGNTFYASSRQRSPVNTECKLLLLTYAFEKLGAIAVEFRTHWHNKRSQAAILRLGAKQDGVLRNHLKYPDGAHRDTVVFSIIESEWPVVRQSLTFKLSS